MNISFRTLHPTFFAEVSGVDLRSAGDDAIAAIRAGMDAHAVLLFRDQPLSDDDQVGFAQRLDGALHTKTGISALQKPRYVHAALTDISNLNDEGGLYRPEDRRRAYSLANRLWHTDASFQDPPGRYSLLHARIVPPAGADTEFADLRTAYDALDDATRARIDGLRVHHSIAHSRKLLGFEFSAEEERQLAGAIHPLVRTLPRSGRKSLYLASHAFRILDWPVPDARVLLMELTEHATQRRFVHRHAWRAGDLVIWDNRCTMHRATDFEDARHPRDLRRVTTLDVEPAAASAAA